MSLSALDRRILDRIQQGIPFVKEPWKALASELKVETPLLLERIKLLKKKNVVRRISATFDPRKMGFVSTLIALKVRLRDLDKVAQRVNKYDEVTHNYKRDCEFNLWFTLVAADKQRMAKVINAIRRDKDVEDLLELPATRLFKIKVNFQV
jgi:DNA-binding Lrp family transcriptional regulator